MAKTIKQIIDEVKAEALSFVGAKRELVKLEAIEKGVPAVGLTALLFLQVVIALLFAMIFASDLLGAYDTVSALAAGFGCLVGLLLLIEFILLLLKKPITSTLEEKIISAQLDKLEDMEEKEAGEARRETATVTMVADVTDVHGESVIPGTESPDHPVVEVHQFTDEDDLQGN